MKSTREVTAAVVRTVLILAVVLALAPLAQAQPLAGKGKVAAATAPTPAKAPATAKPSNGQQEGIKVHGHWIIEVRNPDGTLASRTEFDNALQPDGQTVLAAVLGRVYVPGLWFVLIGDATLLSGSAASGPCDSNGTPVPCAIGEASSPALVVTVPRDANGFPVGTLELSGRATAAHPFLVTTVVTALLMCGTNVNVPTCASTGGNRQFFFSGVNLTRLDQVSLVAGQIISVTVTFTFAGTSS